MTSTWTDDIDSEDVDAEYEGDAEFSEGDFDTEGEGDGEASSAEARRRVRRAYRYNQARRRVPVAGRPTGRILRPQVPGIRPALPAPTAAALQNLDLDTKVGQDKLRLALRRSNQRASRATYASIAGLAVDQALDTFGEDLEDHDLIRAGLRSLPLALLSPARKRPGLEGVLLDPRVIGLAAVAGLLTAGALRTRAEEQLTVDILPKQITASAGTGVFRVSIRDGSGATVQKNVAWSVPDGRTLTVGPDGSFTRIAAGDVFVTATVDGKPFDFAVKVE
jgi:hypothetical protein